MCRNYFLELLACYLMIHITLTLLYRTKEFAVQEKPLAFKNRYCIVHYRKFSVDHIEKNGSLKEHYTHPLKLTMEREFSVASEGTQL